MGGQTSVLKQLAIAAVIFAAAAAAWTQREALASALGLQAATQAPARGGGAAASRTPVIVAPVGVEEDDLTIEAVGTGRAVRSVMLRSESEGKVAEAPLAAGARFEAGETLLRLDDEIERLAVALAQTRLAEAERQSTRFRELANRGAATTVQLDEAATAADIARIELESARAALEDRVLRAPFDGVAGLPKVEPGDRIETSDEIASYDDRSVILVGFDLPEALLSRIGPETRVDASTPSAPGRRFDGEIASVDSRIAEATRTVRVRVAIPNPDDTLRPGASFTVRLALPGAAYPVVPELALHFSRGALRVWRVTDGAADQVEVELVRRLDGRVLVDGALGEGDLVVVEGAGRLSPGREVELVRSRGAPGA